MKHFLLLSAIVPALIIAGVATAEHHDTHRDGPPAHVQKVLETLPDEKSERVMSVLSQLREQRAASYKKDGSKRDALTAIITAETFDKEAYLREKANMRSEKLASRATADETTADLLAGLDAQERQALATIMELRGNHKRGHRRHKAQ